MAQERFINPHLPYEEGGEHQHTSQASHRRRLDAVVNKLREWKQDTIVGGFHEGDHQAFDLEVNPTDQEIVLFQNA